MSNQSSRPGQDNRQTASRSLRAPAVLEVEGSGRFLIEQIATVGRAADSQILLDRPSVSRHHARIFYEGGHYWIKDLESGNGTAVNGKKVDFQMLSDNDTICFGEVKATFSDSEALAGLVALAQDPLEESDPDFRDGITTGDMGAQIEPPGAGQQQAWLEFEVERLRGEVAAKDIELGVLRKKIEALQSENGALREVDHRKRDSATGGFRSLKRENLAEENDRLRRLVSQLERALADSNQRSRNLQDRLEAMSEYEPNKPHSGRSRGE